MKQIYIISYENAQYCGGGLFCLVEATSDLDAETIAENYMLETQLELFGDHYEDEPLEYGDTAVAIVNTEILKDSDYEPYAGDPNQAKFYPKVNF